LVFNSNKKKRGNGVAFSALAAFLLGMPISSLAEGTQNKRAFTGPEQIDYAKNFVRVPAALVGEVLTLEPEKLRRNAMAAGITTLAFASDQGIRDTWQEDIRSSTTDDVSSLLRDTGSRAGGIVILGSAYAYGLATGTHHIRETAQLAAQAVLITQTIGGVKWLTGRERPKDSPGDSWNWGNDGGHAFFSGHSSGVWSAAGVFVQRYPDNDAFKLGVYSWATAVSLTRMNDDAHWASDLLVGGLVGYGVGVMVARYDPFIENNAVVMPTLNADYGGVTLLARF
jgi:membrane-associated phospholipid phosphatase